MAMPKKWATVRESIKEDRSRKTLSRKFKERYKKACEKERLIPMNKVMTQLENNSVHLKGQMLGPKEAKVLAQVLVGIDYITAIDLSANCIGDEGASWISGLIPCNMSITHLNLSENSIGTTGLKALVSGVSENILMIALNISGNPIGDDGAKIIAELLETRTGLRKLRVSHAEISERGATAIGSALAENDTLETLDLSWNHIRGKGAISIANCLKKNKCLRTLDVSWNGFAMEGAKAMGEALTENSRLENLDLSNNRIDRNAVATLIVGLKVNTTLHTLKLGKNPFDTEVAKFLLTILEGHEQCTLISVDFADMPVDDEFLETRDRLCGVRNINISHGRTVRKIPVKQYVPPPPPPRDPVELMFEFKYEHGYRTLDLLNRMDRDNNMTLSRDELKLGLMEMDVQVDDSQVDDIIARLDTNNDGEIDYSELMEGEREYGSRHKRHMNMQTIQKIRSLARTIMQMQIAAKLAEVDTTKSKTAGAEKAGTGEPGVATTQTPKHK